MSGRKRTPLTGVAPRPSPFLPRQRALPQQTARKRLLAQKGREATRPEPGQSGYAAITDYAPSGRKSATVLVSTRGVGQGIGNPAILFASHLRRAMRPLRFAPALVRDAGGAVIAAIVVDAITGRRRREPYVPCADCGERHPLSR